jgi:hypothetical protein
MANHRKIFVLLVRSKTTEEAKSTMKKLTPFLLACVCLPVAAQTTFLGISLDSPFPGDINQCPTRQDIELIDTSRIGEAGVCFFKEPNGRYRVYNTPDLGIGSTLSVETYDDKPIVFYMGFSKATYTQAVDIFAARFGRPTKVYRETVGTRSGGAYESRSAIWNGAKLKVHLDEVGEDIRWSDGVIINVPLWNQRLKKDREAANAAGGKL